MPYIVSYDLEISSTEWLLHAVEIINMRKYEYKNYIELRETEEFKNDQKRYPAHLRLWYEDGKKISEFDQEIAKIISEIDSRGE